MNDYTVNRYVQSIKTNELYEKYVDIKEVHNLCRDCPKYNHNFSCPPFDFDIEEFLLSYDYLELNVTEITFDDKLENVLYTPLEMENLLNKTFFYEEHLTKKMLFKKEMKYRRSVSLIGPCTICGNDCKKFFNNCNNPDKMRYSIESMGIKFDKVLDELFNIKLEFLDEKIPEYLNENEKLSLKKSKLVKHMNSVMGLLYTK